MLKTGRPSDRLSITRGEAGKHGQPTTAASEGAGWVSRSSVSWGLPHQQRNEGMKMKKPNIPVMKPCSGCFCLVSSCNRLISTLKTTTKHNTYFLLIPIYDQENLIILNSVFVKPEVVINFTPRLSPLWAPFIIIFCTQKYFSVVF